MVLALGTPEAHAFKEGHRLLDRPVEHQQPAVIIPHQLQYRGKAFVLCDPHFLNSPIEKSRDVTEARHCKYSDIRASQARPESALQLGGRRMIISD